MTNTEVQSREKQCVFCLIAKGEKEKDEIIYEDADVVVFPDINPRTPIHLMITSKHHYPDYGEMIAQEPELLLRIGKVVEILVDKLGLRGKWYTWGFHCGGKQSVNHVHAQLLAGMKPDELVL